MAQSDEHKLIFEPELVAPVLVDTAKSLISKVLNERHGRAINNVIEFVALICEIVENVAVELYKQNRQTIKGDVKLGLACDIASTVLEQLYNRKIPLISMKTYTETRAIISDLSILAPYIDGVITISGMGSRLQQLKALVSKSCCSCFG